MDQVAGTSTRTESQIKLKLASDELARGYRWMALKNFAKASDVLSKCCSLFAGELGTTHKTMAVPQILYAQALIEQAREHSVGNVVPTLDDDKEDGGNEDTDEDEENETDSRDSAGPKDGQNGTPDEKDANGDASNQNVRPGGSGLQVIPEENENENKKIIDNDDYEDDDDSDDDASQEPLEDDDDDDDDVDGNVGEPELTKEQELLQLAWELLEVSADILAKDAIKNAMLLCECYYLLAEISFTNSNYKEAINDYGRSLECRLSAPIYRYADSDEEKQDRRKKTATYYQRGLCYAILPNYKSSISDLKMACSIIETEIKNNKGEELTDELQKENEFLEDTLELIQEKQAEIQEYADEAHENAKELTREFMRSLKDEENDEPIEKKINKPAADANRPTNVNHLIKRKGNPEKSASTAVVGDNGNKGESSDKKSMKQDMDCNGGGKTAEEKMKRKITEDKVVDQEDVSPPKRQALEDA